MARRGQTIIEVVIAVVLLGCSIIPIMNMLVGTSREAGFSEAHILVQARAFGLLDCQEGLGYDRLLAASSGLETVELAIPAMVPPPWLPRTAAGAKYHERLTFRRLTPDGGKGMLSVEVDWVLGTDGCSGRVTRPHVFKAFRLLSRPDDSWLHSIPLPLTRATTNIEV
jgi:hypothetical protein